MATKKLTDAQREALLAIRDNAFRPNAVLFEESNVFATPGGRVAANAFGAAARKLIAYLVDAGLVEFARGGGHAYEGGYPAAGISRVTDAGLAALESGRYEAEGKAPAGPRQQGWGVIRGTPDPRPITVPIALFTECSDAGPCEPGSPSAFCPHCGSGGRYVWEFYCTNGERRAAMRGCLKLFRPSRLAVAQQAALAACREAREEEKATGRPSRLASWNKDIEMATDLLCHGEITLAEAEGRIQAALACKKSWMVRRGYARR
jgi:hypothetical protein